MNEIEKTVGERQEDNLATSILSKMPEFNDFRQQVREKMQKRTDFVADNYSVPVGCKDALNTIRDRRVNNPINEEYKNLYDARIRVLEGECSPKNIAEKYGDAVEDVGTSLAALNFVITRFMPPTDLINSNSRGSRYFGYDNDPEPYEYFYNELPDVMSRHFSDKVPEDERKMFGSIINKVSSNWNYLPDSNNGDKQELTDDEEDLIVKYYSDALKEAGHSYELFEQEHGDLITKDAAIDGIMQAIQYDGTSSMASDYEMGLYKRIMEKLKTSMGESSEQQ